jgi:hypothetical protein
MRGTITAAALAALLITAPASAVYKCQIGGETVFSQTPCAANAQEIEVKVHRPSEAEVQAAEEREAKMRAQGGEVGAGRERRSIEREIASLEADANIEQKKMDQELATLRARKANANNNLAGATLEQSIATEMKAVAEKHSARISSIQGKIATLQERLKQLNP